MKKGLILGSLFLGTAILTGCGGTETLSCTQEADAATGKTVTKVDATFEGTKVKKIDMSVTMNLEDQYKDYKDQMVKALDTQFDSYKKKDGVDVKTSSDKESVSVRVTADATKMSEDDAKKLLGTDSIQSKSATQKYLEKEGFTCK